MPSRPDPGPGRLPALRGAWRSALRRGRSLGGRHPVRRLVAVVGIGALLGASPWLWVLARSSGHVHRLADAPTAPVALVLGAGLTPSGTPTPFLAARLDVAAQLQRSGRVRVLLVSGDNRVKSYDEPTAMRDYLVARGVPDAMIVRDFAGRDTYDSCSRALRIFGVSRALVVSQGYHLPRAVATCRALGLDAEGVGDWRMESAYPPLWSSYSMREKAAAGKSVWDLLSRRDPVLGPRERGVEVALEAARS